jgi:F-type H+-transporting ATPase subunit a
MTGATHDSMVLAAGKIEIGNHPQCHFAGMTFNLDTIWVSLIAGAIVVILGFWAKRRLTQANTDHVPSKIQLLWEIIVGQVNTQVEANLGVVHPVVVPLAVALFFFILICNWIELIPTELNSHVHLLPSPTADTNLTYAMAIMAMVGVWIFGIRSKGLVGYLKHFLEPYPILLPLNIIEELVKPLTLALRLFGNIFAGGIMISLIAVLLPKWVNWLPNIIWKLFDTLFLGAIQAFIFALLTVLYFGLAGAGHDEEEHGSKTSADAPDTHADRTTSTESTTAEPALTS